MIAAIDPSRLPDRSPAACLAPARIVVVDDVKKARAARVAMLASRTNLLLSLPMLTSMAMYQTLFG